MERRSSVRFDVQQPITAKVLSLTGEIHEISGTLDNISGTGLRIVAGDPVPEGSALQIDLPDAMILAEVRYCALAGPGFAIGFELKQVLSNMGQVARLMENIMGTSGASRSSPNKNDILRLNA